MGVIYVGGVKGAGKSLALSSVFRQLAQTGLNYRRVKVAEVMFKLLKNQGIIKKYDDMEGISSSVRDEIRLQAFQKVLKESREDLIFDGHFAVSSNTGYSYGIPPIVMREIGSLILLYNDVETVFERRQKDSRRRELDFVKIELDLAVEEAFANFYARMMEVELRKIKTGNDAVLEIVNFLRKEHQRR